MHRRLQPLLALSILLLPTPSFAIEALEARNRSFKLLTEGARAYEEGRYADALSMLEEVTRISLNSFQGYYYLGRSYLATRRYEEAIEALDVALELEPGHLQSHIARGDAHLKSGALQEASVAYHRALELQPAYAPSFDGLARIAEAQGKAEEAERIYRRAIDANPGFPDAYLHLGDLYLGQDRVDRAVDLFVQAIQVRPDFARAYNRLGTAYAEQRLFDEAMAAISKARELRPYDGAHPLALGKVLFQLGLRGRARSEYLEAVRLDPDLLEVYLRLAELYRVERRFDEALEVLREGDLRPVDEPLLRRRLREAMEQYGKEKDRLAMLEARVAAGEGLDVDEALLLARLYDGMGDKEEAAEILGGAVEGRRVESAVQFELGYYLLGAGRHREAGEIFSFLSEIDPRNTAALVNLGIAAAALGRLGEAEEAYQKALRVDPRMAEAYLYLGNVYVRLGTHAKAVEAYQQFLQVREGGGHVERVRRILEMLEEDAG